MSYDNKVAVEEQWQRTYENDLSARRIVSVSGKEIRWETNTDFDKGTDDDTEVSGTGDPAFVQLLPNANNDDDIPYTTESNYTLSNGTKLEVNAGKANLKTVGGDSQNYPFTTSGNYTFDSGVVEITGGAAKLKGNPLAPYAWWHLNESTGTNAADSSGNGRNGTTQNMENSDWIAGKLNNCLEFDGVNEYVDCGAIAAFERTQPFSLECWFKTSADGTHIVISNREDTGDLRGWSIRMTDGQLFFNLISVVGTGNRLQVKTDNTYNNGAWRHMVLTYDGSSNASGANFYIDGSTVAQTTVFDDLTGTTISSINTQIGILNGTGFAWLGEIDEVVIYEEELVQGNVTFRYNSGTGTESMPDVFVEDNPTIVPNTGYAFSTAIDTFTETATKTGSEIKYQLSSDDGTTYEWWTGSAWAERTLISVITAVNTIVGTVDAGDLASLQTLDGSTYDVSEIATNPGFTVEMGMTDVNPVGPDNVVIYGYYTGNHTNVNVDIWDFNTTSWVTLGQLATGGGSVVLQSFAVTGTKADKVEDGIVNIRINHDEMGNASHDLFLDYVYVDAPPNDSWYYDNESNLATAINTNINTLAATGDFKFTAFLHSNDSSGTPLLDNILVQSEAIYSTDDDLYLDTKDAVQIAPVQVYDWLTTTITNNTPANTDIRVMFSNDGRVTWLTYTGGSWQAPGSATTRTDGTTITDAVAQFSSIPLGSGTLDVRLFLFTSDDSVTPDVSNINVTSNAGFAASGTYLSNAHNTTYPYSDGYYRITFSVTIPDDTTLSIKTRTSEDGSTWGDWSSAYSNGDDITQSGKYIQWKGDFTGGMDTPELDKLSIFYSTPASEVVNP